MGNFGIKVMKEGTGIGDTDIRNIYMSSKYTMFKQHGIYDTTGILNSGDSTFTVSVTHGLGYVPAFLSFVSNDSDGVSWLIPSLPYGIDVPLFVESWADTTKIYFKVTYVAIGQPSYNTFDYYASDYYNARTGSTFSVQIGDQSGTNCDGAIRFTGVGLDNSQTITSATIDYYVQTKGSNTGDLLYRVFGIDEDNTSDFSSYPMGRSTTTAVTNPSQNMGSSTPFSFGINVKTQLEEIISRVGWSSGNALGFLLFDRTSPDDCYAFDATFNSFLRIVIPGSVTFNFRAIVFKDQIA